MEGFPKKQKSEFTVISGNESLDLSVEAIETPLGDLNLNNKQREDLRKTLWEVGVHVKPEAVDESQRAS